MNIFIGIFSILFGLSIGSFLNVAVQRPRNKNKKERTLGGRSFCDYCKHVLGLLDLIPVISFVALRGKCRYCKTKISLKNLLGELFTAISFFLFGEFVYKYFIEVKELNEGGQVLLIVYLCMIFFLLVYTAVHDIWWMEIPLLSSLVGVFLAVCYKLVYIFIHEDYSFHWLPYSIIPIAVIFLINIVYKKQAFGAGDYFLLIILGLTLKPVELFIALETAVLAGALVGLLFAAKAGKLKGLTIPLVPFLVFGWLVALNWGDEIVNFLLPVN
ncbi:MAG: Leader peptidase (Prepilin peptidase)/N-methyltransferase [candidate division WS6 bacterium GW2011_GWA2_37_6]|uniref:Leader peptidase (Prepilin peptidase)/N-methyltransferase n=1 Tax=candidate division WS6 bacterium GW2011_GWA2_37_6 TaxID=1619087 RepID=A0A0G0H9Z7_9BACT|nr:MAG: Leader peptidase (Prepilin peptidase)/N-methyltransferase [candidate division WS6 bacterium GW2011_GWA2_37_6]